MLDGSDKDFIKRKIEEAVYWRKPDKDEPKTKLERKVKDNKASIAERLQYEKLRSFGEKINKLEAAGVLKTLKHLGDYTKAVRQTSIAKGIENAFIYSNPLTAAIANNKDIITALGKGIGGILLGSGKLVGNTLNPLIKSKNLPDKPQGRKLIESKRIQNQNTTTPYMTNKLNSIKGTSYIIAKNALFVGGKNFINLNIPNSSYEGFKLNNEEKGGSEVPSIDSSKNIINKTKLLEDKKKSKTNYNSYVDVNISQKNSKAQLNEAKTTNKLLGSINKRMVLIVGGVLLGGAAIAALSAFLYSKFNLGKKPTTSNIKPNIQAKAFNDLSKTNLNTRVDNINQALRDEVKLTGGREFKKTITIGKNSFDTPLVSGFTANSKEGSVYRAPFDMKIKYFKENTKKEGVINIIAEKRSLGVDKDIELMNIINPVVYPGQIVKKNEPIGQVGPGGQIHIKDISEQDFNEYIQSNNNLVDAENKQNFELTQEANDKINEYYETLSKQKNRNPEKEAKVGKYTKSYLDQQDNIENNRNKLAIKTLQEAVDNDYNGTYLNGRYIPKEQLQVTLSKYKSSYDEGNKNMEIAKSQVAQAKVDNQTKIIMPEKPLEKPNNISISKGVTKSKYYGLAAPMDIAMASSNTFAL